MLCHIFWPQVWTNQEGRLQKPAQPWVDWQDWVLRLCRSPWSTFIRRSAKRFSCWLAQLFWRPHRVWRLPAVPEGKGVASILVADILSSPAWHAVCTKCCSTMQAGVGGKTRESHGEEVAACYRQCQGWTVASTAGNRRWYTILCFWIFSDLEAEDIVNVCWKVLFQKANRFLALRILTPRP